MVFNRSSVLCIGTRHMGTEGTFLLGMIVYGGILAGICAVIVWAIAFRMHSPRKGMKQEGRK
jgi:hypothetical protein